MKNKIFKFLCILFSILLLGGVCLHIKEKKIKQQYFIINPYAGIGNQMFRYAFGLNYAKKFNKKVCIPEENRLIKIFEISIPSCDTEDFKEIHPFLYNIRHGNPPKLEKLNHFYEDGPQNDPAHMAFDGYQQDPRFFSEIQNLILKEFTFKNPLTPKAQEISKSMQQTNSVCLHFRRGDYLKLGYPVLGTQYYFDAINYIKEKTNSPVQLYAFSDDIKWVKENFKPKDPIVYVDEFNAEIDLQLMTHCKHNVIANSTFSWWGAYLNKNPNKIIVAPDVWDRLDPNWGKNILPPSWKVIHADYTKGNGVAIIYIATGRYINFFKIFYPASEKYFLPNIPKTYFVFTDDKTMPLPKNAIRIYQEQLPWPYITLKRFHFINSIANKLANYEYIYFANANLQPIVPIGNEVLPSYDQHLVFAQHFYQSKFPLDKKTYSRNKKSKAFIPYGEGKYYVFGAFFGGKSMDFLEVSKKLQEQIDEDLKNNVIAEWHDESHLNRYLVDYLKEGNSPIILSPTFLMPQKEYHPLAKKPAPTDASIIILDKKNFGGHDKLRENPNFFKKLYWKVRLFINRGILK